MLENIKDRFHFHSNHKTRGTQEHLFGGATLPKEFRIERKKIWAEGSLYSEERTEGGTTIPERQLGAYISSLFWKYFIIGIIFLFGIFAVRALYLQIYEGDKYRLQAEDNRLRLVPILPERGKILDKNGTIIADNEPLYQLVLISSDWKQIDKSNKTAIIETLQHNMITIDSARIEKEMSEKPEIILSELTYKDALRFITLTQSMKGITVKISSRRIYHDPEIFSHIIGYLSPLTAEQYQSVGSNYLFHDYRGTTGIESIYEKELRGILGKKSIETNAYGKEEKVISIAEPVNGTDLYLTIDSAVQKKLFDIMKRQIHKKGLSRGAALVINRKTGGILAMVSLPAYNNQHFYQGLDSIEYQRIINDPNKPLFNRAISGQYPPGSTFKLIVASAGLEDGLITPNTTVFSEGGIRVSRWFFPDWKKGGHGFTNLYKAIAESVNTYFYILGGGYKDREGLGVQRINEEAKKFGLGKKTNVDIPNEESGFLPTKEWKERVKQEQWYIGDTYNLSIGQGDVLVTPIQMAHVIATIANDGIPTTPHLLNYALTGHTNGKKSMQRERSISKKTIQPIKKALLEATLTGSGRRLQSVPAVVAGKTGTAEWRSDRNPHAWYIGYAPYKDPDIAFAILVEEGGEGSVSAVPIAQEFLTWYFMKYTTTL